MAKIRWFIVLMLLAGCAGVPQQVVLQTAAEMLAEEVGIAMAADNPNLVDKVVPYYATMRDLYETGDAVNLTVMTQYGVEYLMLKYAGDDLAGRRIASKVMRLMAMSGLQPSVEIPSIDAFGRLAPDYIIGVAGAFVAGMQMG